MLDFIRLFSPFYVIVIHSDLMIEFCNNIRPLERFCYEPIGRVCCLAGRKICN